MKNREKIYRITAILLIIDQILKIIIVNSMNLYQEISIIPHFFSITYVENSGAAFSILENHTILLIAISILFLLGIDHFIKKQCLTFHQYEIISFGMIIAGIFGNLFDRIYYRKVLRQHFTDSSFR